MSGGPASHSCPEPVAHSLPRLPTSSMPERELGQWERATGGNVHDDFRALPCRRNAHVRGVGQEVSAGQEAQALELRSQSSLSSRRKPWEALEAAESVLGVGLPSSFHFHIRMTEWPTLLRAPQPSPSTRPREEGSSSPQ